MRFEVYLTLFILHHVITDWNEISRHSPLSPSPAVNDTRINYTLVS